MAGEALEERSSSQVVYQKRYLAEWLLELQETEREEERKAECDLGKRKHEARKREWEGEE